jgi:hypothetical protein
MPTSSTCCKNVDNLSGFTLHTELSKGKVGMFFDLNYAKLGVDNIATEAGDVDVTSNDDLPRSRGRLHADRS